MKCSKCGKTIPKGTRYIRGRNGGKYHVHCAYVMGLKDKSYAYTK